MITENQANDTQQDEYLYAVKREEQERSRASVKSGKHTQEAILFMAPSIVRNATFRRRTEEF